MDIQFTVLNMGDLSNFPIKIDREVGKSRRIVIRLESISEYSNLE